MIKNSVCAGKQTICVLGADGSEVGSTYPRRAAGLVKKGRACYVNDFTIRLDMSDAIHNSEVIKMDNNMNIQAEAKTEDKKVLKLYFDARSWKFNRDCNHNVGGRSFMEGPDGELGEAYMIGDWGNNWTEIVSETLLLPKHTDCSLVFWLNGGENDRNDEVCRFEVVLNNDYEQRFTYNLNRNYIRPLKKLNGWELYEIPFRTLDNEYTQLRFVAQRAYTTVMAAADPSAYAHLSDTPDPFEEVRPQRHNLIFAGGFPKNNCWYSTEQMMKKHGIKMEDAAKHGIRVTSAGVFRVTAGMPVQAAGESQIQLEQIWKKMDEVTKACEEIQSLHSGDFINRLRGALEDAIAGEDDVDEIVDRVVDEVEAAMSNRVEDVRDALEGLAGQMGEIKDTLLDE